jgi:succinate dehydrogenase/fumarate reductase flavoprotein subunit
MKLGSINTITTDVLIIGGGGAGLRAAIEAKSHGVDVLMVSQSRVGYGSNTTISGGAFAAVLGQPRKDQNPSDSCEQHLRDTITAGCFINDQALAEIMVRGAEQQVKDLYCFGVRYTTTEASPWISLSMDPGHSHSRLVYGQHSFGTDFTFPLRQYALGQGVKFAEGVLLTKLLKQGNSVVGALGIGRQGQVLVFAASSIILASGGLGQVYLRTDNAAGTMGDGYALAYEAGAVLQDMEFVQFYPTSLGSGTPAPFYECFFFETGGRLLNWDDADIARKHGLTDSMLLTRDRLSLAIAREIASGLGFEDKVVLDLSGIPEEKIEKLQPILPKGYSRGERRFLVAPTAHFHMGGVKINEKAETSLPSLYAAGEVCAAIHGANRLSGNALTEVWVFGTIAGREAAGRAKEDKSDVRFTEEIAAEIERLQELASRQDGERAEPLCRSLKETMWHRVGIIRNAEGLKQALKEIANLKERYCRISTADGRELQLAIRLGNMLTASEMICRTALLRSESRGAHYRQDFPEQNDKDWLCNMLLVKKDGQMALSTKPVKLTRFSP